MATELWVEKYRPKTLNEYVFRDLEQKNTVEQWVKNKSIPNLLLTGSAGIGKCLGANTPIHIQIDYYDLLDGDKSNFKFVDLIDDAAIYEIAVKHLFEYLDIDNIQFDELVPAPDGIYIDSPNGFVKINYFIKKLAQTARYIFSDGSTLTCSTKHLVFQNSIPKLISECNWVDTVSGPIDIVDSYDEGMNEVYDFSLDYPHQYITPNGIIHHNTTLAKVLINELDIHPFDVLELNASRNNSVDDVRNKITNFVQMIPFGDFKVVLLDEFDYGSLNMQAALRGLIEEYSTARFLFTANFPHKIMPAIHSRCQGFHFEKIDITEFTARVASILIEENIQFDLDTLDTFVKSTYPDLRKCINLLQQNSTSGSLILPKVADNGAADYKVKMVELFKNGKISEARKLLCGSTSPEDIEDIFRWCYLNIELFGDDEATQDKAVLIIKDGLVDHTIISDPEINLASVLIKLSRLRK